MTRRRLGVVATAAVAAVVTWRLVAAPSVREDLPPEFAGKHTPLDGAEAVAAGARVFRDNCASCHGDDADGHGPASRGLTPPPANFRGGPVLAQHSDAYLFYRVTTGKPGTAMPSFHGALGDTEKWQVIAYLRSLAPHAR